jgi:DNA repair exonuclease SbcCD ATPase subunit
MGITDDVIYQKISRMRRNLDQQMGKRLSLIEIKNNLEKKKEALSIEYNNALLARSVVQIVAEETQKKIEYRISSLVTMALASIFPDPYEFKLRFIQRRGKTEADLVFIKNENEITDILNAGGGGPADIASFALRIALWSIKKSRPIQLLDEPMRFVSRNLQPKVSALLKELSDEFNLQFIIISHIPELCEQADKEINIEGGED